MIEAHRVDRVEAREVVFAWRVVAVPRDDVERRMIDRRAPQLTTELSDELERAFMLAVRGHGGEEIARVGEAVAADRAELGKAQQRTVVFADIAARMRVDVAQLDAETNAP